MGCITRATFHHHHTPKTSERSSPTKANTSTCTSNRSEEELIPVRPPSPVAVASDKTPSPEERSKQEAFDYAEELNLRRWEDLLVDPFTLKPLSVALKGGTTASKVASTRQALGKFLEQLQRGEKDRRAAPKEEDEDEDDDEDTTDCTKTSLPIRRFRAQRSRAEVYELLFNTLSDLQEDALDGREDDEKGDHQRATASKWEEVGGTDCFWHLWWTWRKPRPKECAWFFTQRVNHIPNSSQLTRKDLLKTNVQRYCKGRGSAAPQFKVLPDSFQLPSEYVPFVNSFGSVGGLWIMKPVGMSRGRGITIVQSIDDVVYSDSCVIQRYVERPLLLKGFKFDLRLYVVATSFSPLECFVSHLGFARLATKPYALDSFDDKGMHLTNTAVAQKKHVIGTTHSSANRDTKWPLEKVRHYLEGISDFPGWDTLWGKICQTLLTVMACAEDQIPSTTTPNCFASSCTFELLGFDVLIDEDYRPWVLEVNASPSLEVTGEVDEWLKPQLMKDIVQLVDPIPVDVDALIAALELELKSTGPRGGPTSTKPRVSTTTGSSSPSATSNPFNEMLHKVLLGRVPRRYGEPPAELGSFEQLAPSPTYAKVLAAKRKAF